MQIGKNTPFYWTIPSDSIFSGKLSQLVFCCCCNFIVVPNDSEWMWAMKNKKKYEKRERESERKIIEALRQSIYCTMAIILNCSLNVLAIPVQLYKSTKYVPLGF